MRRSISLLLLGPLAGGCATGIGHAPTPHPAIPASYSEAPASALAFDPTLDSGMPHPELARAGREPSAFLGFDQGSTEFYTTATDTAQTDLGLAYIQESVSVRSGSRSR